MAPRPSKIARASAPTCTHRLDLFILFAPHVFFPVYFTTDSPGCVTAL